MNSTQLDDSNTASHQNILFAILLTNQWNELNKMLDSNWGHTTFCSLRIPGLLSFVGSNWDYYPLLSKPMISSKGGA